MRRMALVMVLALMAGCGTMQEFMAQHGWHIARDIGVSVLKEVREEVPADSSVLERGVRIGMDLLLRWLSTAAPEERT